MSDAEQSTREVDRVMVDIETIGLDTGSVIASIGAVRFDVDGLGDTFTQSVSIASCQAAGLSIDAETLEWWLTQDDAAREQLTGGDDLEDALFEFSNWYHGADEIWANSPSFDCEMLEAAYEAVDAEPPWEFYEERDYRTIASLPIAPDIEQDGVEHDALDDATHQARVVAQTLNHIKVTNRV